MTLIYFFLCTTSQHALGYCHAGRPIHNPFLVFLLKKGAFQSFYSTWLHSLAPQSGEIARYLLQTHPQTITGVNCQIAQHWFHQTTALPPNPSLSPVHVHR